MKKFATVFIFCSGSIFISAQNTCAFFSTYFGGSQSDEIKSVCVDTNKNSYLLGNTYSTTLPVTPGLINDTHSGNYDAFLAKLDSCGSLVWCTYFGSTNFDSGEKITLMHDGNLVFCGYTNSLNTPTTTGCFQVSNNGSYDCFLTKITPNGTIIWSTYFGKSGGDFAYDVKTDALDNIIIGGTTTSAGLYTTAGSFQPNHKGNTDAFIARFSKDGALKWCTYYGGNNSEDIHDLYVDEDYNIIGAGGSFSTNLNMSPGSFQALNEGGADAYLIKLDSNCTRVFSTYFGGSGTDDAWGLSCDDSGNIYLAGHTNSADFDTTALSYQTFNNGYNDWYLSKWSPTGTLMASTLFGGAGNDFLVRMVSQSQAGLFLLGKTESTTLPVIGSNNQQNNHGNYDAFLAKFDMNTLRPVWTSYYGGSGDEDPQDLIISGTSFIEFSGSTNSVDYPLSQSPYQPTLQLSLDGFISKLVLEDGTTTSLHNPAMAAQIELYPNPCTNYFQIANQIVLNLECHDLLGKDFSELLSPETKNRWGTDNLKPGVYFISVNTNSGTKIIKLIKGL
jgi:hypothetical protein